MSDGLAGVVAPFMPVAEGGRGAYLAHLQVRAMGHGRAADPEEDPFGPELSRLGERPDLQLWMAWTFHLMDRRGRTVVRIERMTPGPRAITDLARDGEAAVRELENAVLEEVAAAIEGARLHRSVAENGGGPSSG
jgi:hypothetical protein